MYRANDSVFAEATILTPEPEPESRSFMWLVVAMSVITASLLLVTGGSFMAAAVVLGATAVVALTFYRLDWGFYLFIGMVLLCDQFPPRGYDTTIIGEQYFQNLKGLPLFASVDFAVLSPLELHLLLVVGVWVLLIAMGKRVLLQKVTGWLPALVFFFCLAISAAFGMARGGDFLPALWELRALIYLGLMYFLVPQIIQTRSQLITLMWVCIGAISFKALLGIVRIVRLGFAFGERTELTNHEDPLFFISLIVMLLGLTLYGGGERQKKFIRWMLVPMLFVFFLAQRRAAYIALVVAVIGFLFTVSKAERAAILRILLPAIGVFAVYMAIFWNTEGTIGLPAQLVKSSIWNDKQTAGERYYSNMYREYENYDLAQTLKRSPLIGIGFGNKYDQPISLVGIPFSLRDYIPHNEIYWLIVKMGAIGFLFFWLFFDLYIFQAAHTFLGLRDPYLKTICAVSIIAIMGQIVVSFVDLQLTFYRNMIFLGAMMGLMPTLGMIDTTERAARISAETR